MLGHGGMAGPGANGWRARPSPAGRGEGSGDGRRTARARRLAGRRRALWMSSLRPGSTRERAEGSHPHEKAERGARVCPAGSAASLRRRRCRPALPRGGAPGDPGPQSAIHQPRNLYEYGIWNDAQGIKSVADRLAIALECRKRPVSGKHFVSRYGANKPCFYQSPRTGRRVRHCTRRGSNAKTLSPSHCCMEQARA